MATNKVYSAFGAAKAFMVAGGDVALPVQNLANNAGAFSAQLNLGVSPRPTAYYWRATTKIPSAPTANTTIDIYAIWGDNSNNTNVDGGYNNAGGATGSLQNLKRIGSIIVEAASANIVLNASGYCLIPSQYVQIAWFNNSGQALANTNTDHAFILSSIADDIQAAS